VLLQLAAPLWRIATPSGTQRKFVFYPHNHHDHFHVHYLTPGVTAYPGKVEDAVARFAQLLPAWSGLGIDFKPLIAYLDGFGKFSGTHPAFQRLDQERTMLKQALAGYTKAADISALLAIFEHLMAGSALVEPVLSSAGLSKDIRVHVATTEQALKPLSGVAGFESLWRTDEMSG
jgi:hypothetical protein